MLENTWVGQIKTYDAGRSLGLKVYLTQERAWKERFHQNMFDTVALAIMASIKG